MQINFNDIKGQLPKRWQNTIAERCNCSVSTVYAATKWNAPFYQDRVWEALYFLKEETKMKTHEKQSALVGKFLNGSKEDSNEKN